MTPAATSAVGNANFIVIKISAGRDLNGREFRPQDR